MFIIEYIRKFIARIISIKKVSVYNTAFIINTIIILDTTLTFRSYTLY